MAARGEAPRYDGAAPADAASRERLAAEGRTAPR